MATTARPWSIALALAIDAIAWVIPWLVAVPIAIFVPVVSQSPLALTVVLILAFALTTGAIAADIHSFRENGYTDGLRRRHLRVIDPINDVVLYKARLYKKSVWKLLRGRYAVIDIG